MYTTKLQCDGVLVDTETASCESLHLAILHVTGFDIPHKFPEDYFEVFGMDVRNCCVHYWDKFKLQDKWTDIDEIAARVAKEKEPIYQALTTGGIHPWSGAKELIETVLAQAIPLGLASSGSPEKIRHNLTSAGLLSYFTPNHIVSAKMVARGKPFPDVYVEALRRVGCMDPSRCLVVEDAIHGLNAARAAGCFVVGITNSLPREHLAPHADAVVDTLQEVHALLDMDLGA